MIRTRLDSQGLLHLLLLLQPELLLLVQLLLPVWSPDEGIVRLLLVLVQHRVQLLALLVESGIATEHGHARATGHLQVVVFHSRAAVT